MSTVDLKGLLSSASRDFVVSHSGDKVAVSSLLDKDLIIGLYFSAHWCPPCRGFTPVLAKVYNELKAQGKRFEVVFYSSDQGQAAFDEYHKEMPWLAVPFDDRACKEAASDAFKVEGIPTLVLLDGAGNVIDRDGRKVIMKKGAAGYPYRPDPEMQKRIDAEMKLLPQTVKDHRHPHPLPLVPKAYKGSFGCNGCGDEGEGWVYHCDACQYDLHPKCVETVKTERKHDLKELLGDTLMRGSGPNQQTFATAELTTDPDRLVGLYFSAHWCGPCRAMTPSLVQLYKDMAAAGKKLEIVFVSFDREQEAFDEYFAEMPWAALPFSNRDAARATAQRFKVSGIPAMALLDASGAQLLVDVREVVSRGVAGYPFKANPEAALKQAEAQAREDAEMLARPQTAKDYRHEHPLTLVHKDRFGCDGCRTAGSGWRYRCKECDFDMHAGCLADTRPEQKVDLAGLLGSEGRDYVIGAGGKQVPVASLVGDKDAVIGLYFSAHWCPPCRGFTPVLAKVYNELKEKSKKFEVVFFSSDRDQGSFDEYHKEMPWLAVPFADRDAKAKASGVFNVSGIPTLVLIDGQGNIITDDGRDAVVSRGADGFPFRD